MSRPIDGDAFSDWLKEYGQEYIHGKKKISLMYIWKHVQDMPTITPERKRGRWETYLISMIDGEGCRCSECGFEGVPYWEFCPNCGIEMTEDELCK